MGNGPTNYARWLIFGHTAKSLVRELVQPLEAVAVKAVCQAVLGGDEARLSSCTQGDVQAPNVRTATATVVSRSWSSADLLSCTIPTRDNLHNGQDGPWPLEGWVTQY